MKIPWIFDTIYTLFLFGCFIIIYLIIGLPLYGIERIVFRLTLQEEVDGNIKKGTR